MILEQLDQEVQRLADEATPTLLPMLLAGFLRGTTGPDSHCERHVVQHPRYVAAKIRAHRAKREWNRGDYYGESGVIRSPVRAFEKYQAALYLALQAKTLYHSIPCTCLVPHK